MISSIFVLFVAVYIMGKCSSSFDLAANYLTRNLGEGIKGPTVNAIASSLPELLISSMFLFYFKDINGFSAGYATIVGSSAFNIALIPVIAFLFVYFKQGRDKVFEINKSIVKQDTLFLLGAILILSLGFVIGVTYYLALLLLGFYCIYMIYVIKTRSSNKKDESFFSNLIEEDKLEEIEGVYVEKGSLLSSLVNIKLFRLLFRGRVNTFTSYIVIILSIFIIGASCYFLVLATENISHILGINLFFGAFIIAAIASSVPDTILSVQDAKNDKFVDSFSNAYGSNVFDICIGIGLPVLVYSLIYGPISMNMPIDRMGWLGDEILSGNLFMWSLLMLFVFTSLVSLIYYRGNIKLNKALLILSLYLLFVIGLIIY